MHLGSDFLVSQPTGGTAKKCIGKKDKGGGGVKGLVKLFAPLIIPGGATPAVGSPAVIRGKTSPPTVCRRRRLAPAINTGALIIYGRASAFSK